MSTANHPLQSVLRLTRARYEVPIARRNLLADKVKFLAALGGVTLAVLLILVVQSLYQGIKHEYASFIDTLPGDAFVAQRGISGIVFSNPFLTRTNTAEVASIPGVKAVHRLYGRMASFQVEGKEVSVYVWAVAPGGVLTPEQERTFPRRGTIIIDRSLAVREGLSPGDVMQYGGNPFVVAGVGPVGNILVAQFGLIHPDDYALLFANPSAKFFLVSLEPGAGADTLAAIARRVPASSVYSREQFLSVAQEPVGDFLPIIRVVVVLSVIVGLALLSLMVYSATIERAREYGIMKVLGASSWRLYGIVLSQSALIALAGFGAGVGLALGFNRVAGDIAPEFVTYIRWQDILAALGVTVGMTLAAAYLPINRVARVDPASVFRA